MHVMFLFSTVLSKIFSHKICLHIVHKTKKLLKLLKQHRSKVCDTVGS